MRNKDIEFSLDMQDLPEVEDSKSRSSSFMRPKKALQKSIWFSLLGHIALFWLISTSSTAPHVAQVNQQQPTPLKARLIVLPVAQASTVTLPPTQDYQEPVAAEVITPKEVVVPANAEPKNTNAVMKDRLDEVFERVARHTQESAPSLTPTDLSHLVKPKVATPKIEVAEQENFTPPETVNVVDDVVEEVDIDPLLEYQQKIAQRLQSYISADSSWLGRECVLKMTLSRDGLVLSNSPISGHEEFCSAVQKAALRAGKMPVPKDDSVFAFLEELRITVLTPEVNSDI